MWATAFAATLVSFFADAVKGIVGRLLVALGFGIVTATGINAAITYAMGSATNFGGTGNVYFQQTISAIGLPWFISTLVSAISTRAALKGLTSDGLSFWIMRKQVG